MMELKGSFFGLDTCNNVQFSDFKEYYIFYVLKTEEGLYIIDIKLFLFKMSYITTR